VGQLVRAPSGARPGPSPTDAVATYFMKGPDLPEQRDWIRDKIYVNNRILINGTELSPFLSRADRLIKAARNDVSQTGGDGEYLADAKFPRLPCFAARFLANLRVRSSPFRPFDESEKGASRLLGRSVTGLGTLGDLVAWWNQIQPLEPETDS